MSQVERTAGLSATPAVFLGLVMLVCMLIVGSVRWFSADRILASEQAMLELRLQQVLSPSQYNNNPGEDIRIIDTKGGPVTVYRARIDGKAVAAIFDITSGRGYAGPIRILIGILENGEISAVRVLSHKETPGLGDDIEISRSDWINGFTGKSSIELGGQLSDRDWQVKKDGGVFDQFTGATITPRAVVNSVYSTLRLYQIHRKEVFQ